ncbi:MAG: guanine deaminase [Bacteroidota bacterium]
MAVKAFAGDLFYFKADPSQTSDSYVYQPDSVLLTENGKVKEIQPATNFSKADRAKYEWFDFTGKLIMPGFIDTHIHFPQTEMIGSYGEALLEWLEKYTFPTEMKFSDRNYAQKIAQFFLDELLRNGTTTALVFGTVHKSSVEVFFEEAFQRNLRMISGKVLMDRNAPEELQDTPEIAYRESKELIEEWHEKGRLAYAVTPRFAITSSPEQLQAAGRLLQVYPNVYLHTHLAENSDEVAFTKSLFPAAKNYLDVYNNADLLTSKSVFAHSIHLSDDEWQTMQKHQCNIAFCPTSNLFLGSGLFNLKKAEQYEINVGMGTDIGAGTSFNMLTTLNEAYKVTQLKKGMYSEENHSALSPLKAFYLATLGGAKTLNLADKIGSFDSGMEADFNVIDWATNPLQKLRMKSAKTIEEKLFALQILGNQSNIFQTFVMANKVEID